MTTRLEDPTERRRAPRPGRVAAVIAVGAITLYNLAWRLGTDDWYVDETVYLASGREYLHGTFTSLPGHPPLGMYLLGLADRLFGPGLTAARVVPVLVALATTAVLFCFARHVAGFWPALLVAALWAIVPRPARMGGITLMAHRIDRFAILDLTAGLFLLLGLYAGWRWLETRGWAWCIGAGTAFGLAAMAKLPGGTGLVVLLVLSLIVLPRDRLALRQAITLALLMPAVAIVVYAPFGSHALGAIQDMVHFQSSQVSAGHPVILDGRTYRVAPWWAHLRYQWEGDGPVVTLALLGAVVAALVTRPRRLTGYLLAAIALPVIVLSMSPVKLPHYRELWLPEVILLAGLGISGLVSAGLGSGAHRQGSRPVLASIAAALLLAPLLLAGGVDSVHLAGEHPGDYRRAAALVTARAPSGGVVVVAGYPQVAQQYLDAGHPVLDYVPADRSVGAVIVDPLWARRWDAAPLLARARSLGLHRVAVGRLGVWIAARS